MMERRGIGSQNTHKIHLKIKKAVKVVSQQNKPVVPLTWNYSPRFRADPKFLRNSATMRQSATGLPAMRVFMRGNLGRGCKT